ncbi:MAG TPA: hypothetical protein VMO88_16380 [Acidimicrobiales bacterium]|nr:hypothetical protein [Acidimicrobiales bacterium]
MRQRILVALVLVAGLVCACDRAAAPPARTSPPAPSPQQSGTSPTAVESRCTLSPAEGLQRVTTQARGPLGTVSRTYELHVPPGVGKAGGVPLLVSLHGLGQTGAMLDAITGWSAFADARAQAGSPFIVALPDGLQSTWFWGFGESYDVDFLFRVIADLRATGCLDPSAIYVDGWSAGGYMAQRMACVGEARGVTLAGVHSYAGGDPASLVAPCAPPVALPVLLSDGLDDQLSAPLWLGFPAFTAWGRRYSCAPPALSYAEPQRLSGCSAGAAVAWWPLDGFDHLTWSCDGDRFFQDRAVWAFLTLRVAPTATTCH